VAATLEKTITYVFAELLVPDRGVLAAFKFESISTAEERRAIEKFVS